MAMMSRVVVLLVGAQPRARVGKVVSTILVLSRRHVFNLSDRVPFMWNAPCPLLCAVLCSRVEEPLKVIHSPGEKLSLVKAMVFTSSSLADLNGEALHDVRKQASMLLDKLFLFLCSLGKEKHYQT